jgi:hypothetical protein
MYPRVVASLVVLIVLTAPLRAQEVVGFTLIDASTDREIRPLRDGDTIDFKTEGTELNIRADVRGNVGSVRFELNGGQWTDTETAPPFSIGPIRKQPRRSLSEATAGATTMPGCRPQGSIA